jgi:hypothetical protein
VPDGNARRRGDDELPPDPWAGLAGSPSPPPSSPPPLPPRPGSPGWDDPGHVSGDQPSSHPAFGGGGQPPATERDHVPPPRRTIWHHPAVWVALLLLAGVLLAGALLERPTPRPSQPSPDAVTATSPAAPGT